MQGSTRVCRDCSSVGSHSLPAPCPCHSPQRAPAGQGTWGTLCVGPAGSTLQRGRAWTAMPVRLRAVHRGWPQLSGLALSPVAGQAVPAPTPNFRQSQVLSSSHRIAGSGTEPMSCQVELGPHPSQVERGGGEREQVCKGVHMRVHAGLYVILTRCHRWHHLPLTVPRGWQGSVPLAPQLRRPAPALPWAHGVSVAAASALLQPTALGPVPITDPQLRSTSTQRPGCGVPEQCRAPSQMIPLRGYPQRAQSQAAGPTPLCQGPEAAWPPCIAPAPAVRMHRRPLRWARHCQPHAMALLFL